MQTEVGGTDIVVGRSEVVSMGGAEWMCEWRTQVGTVRGTGTGGRDWVG